MHILIRQKRDIDMSLPKGLQKLLDDPRVQSIEDERNEDNGYWVYLVNGWFNPYLETHCIHEDTVKAVLDQMKDIEKCHCEWCD